MASPTPRPAGHRTLADLYTDRGLTPAQARRLVALLGLAEPRTERNKKAA
jgi:hypothetical protein